VFRRRFLNLAALISAIVTLNPLASRADVVTGTVKRAEDLAPISGAKVTLQASLTQTFAAIDGTFSIDIPEGQALVIVGAAKGYYNAGVTLTAPTSGVEILLTQVPLQDDPNYQFMSPETCGTCHPNQLANWNNSPMAKAGTNTWVHDIYNGMGTPGGLGGFVYTRDSVFAGNNPNSECASCHQPESWIPTPFSRMEGPQDTGYPSTPAAHGISCDVCHKVADIDVTKIDFPGIFPGAVKFQRPQGPSPHQVQYGLLGDTTVNLTNLMRASYQPQLSAEVCGACHQDRSDPDENHTYTGPISEPTYTEWADSPYSDPQSPYYADCISCHMPPTGETQFCQVQIPPLTRDPSLIRSHDIRGTTPQFLENAVTMTMLTNVQAGTLEIEVTIDNDLTGHHVPTGVTTRNMILVVEAWPEGEDPIGDLLPYTGSQFVHDLGGLGDPALGYYGGRPGKLYAKLNHDALNNAPTFFTDAVGFVFDNRLAALESDTTNYAFQLPNEAGEIHVRARLLYRRAWRALVDAKGWTQDGHGNPLGDVQPPHYGHLMELSETTIPYCPSAGTGDVNNDGLVDGLDITAFVTVLLNNANGPASTAFCEANLHPDAVVDVSDLNLFVLTMLE